MKLWPEGNFAVLSVFSAIILSFLFLSSCRSAAPPTAETASDIESSMDVTDVDSDVKYLPVVPAEQSESSVIAYRSGYDGMTVRDLAARLSSGGGYNEKWELFLYSRPYQVRLRFEISNFAFSENEGRVRGKIVRYEGDEQVEEIGINEVFKAGSWSASRRSLDVKMGSFRLYLNEEGEYVLEGKQDDVSFRLITEARSWKPGTGDVIFGKDGGYLSYQVMTIDGAVRGAFERGGVSVPVTGTGYGNHYATNVAVQEMADEFYDSRLSTEDGVFIEYRYYRASSKYGNVPFGFFVVAYQGEVIFSTTDLRFEGTSEWLDDAHYGYVINNGIRIRGSAGNDFFVFEALPSTDIEAKDVYSNLSRLQRAVAERFAKPVDYNVTGSWRLDLHIDGMDATVHGSKSYSITRLR